MPKGGLLTSWIQSADLRRYDRLRSVSSSSCQQAQNGDQAPCQYCHGPCEATNKVLLSSYPERNVEILHLLGVVWAAPILNETVTRLGIRQIMRRLMNSRAAGANEPTIFISFHEFRTSHQLLYTLSSSALRSGVATSDPSIPYTLGVHR
jgi:hypothetical protein